MYENFALFLNCFGRFWTISYICTWNFENQWFWCTLYIEISTVFSYTRTFVHGLKSKVMHVSPHPMVRLGNGSKLPATWNNKKRPKKNFAFGDRRGHWCRFPHTYQNIQVLCNLSKNRVTTLPTFNVVIIVEGRIPNMCSWRRLFYLRKFPEQEKIS